MTAAAAVSPVLNEAVLSAALTGLTARGQKSLPPWLFYDETGSQLFEQITALPEYYLTRTERELFVAHADEIVTALGTDVTLAELGAGSAAKTGVLLRAAAKFQSAVLYQPIDISPSALEEAAAAIAEHIPGVNVASQVANYITERYNIERPEGSKVLALYIGSSIGNFSPNEAVSILRNLRHHLQPGDALLLGTDLAPSAEKPVDSLLAAYDDAAGVTAAFNLNVLTRLNAELGADFDVAAFAHRARWNEGCSRIEMHLESLIGQTVHVAGETVVFAAGETIHTENSHKFSEASIRQLVENADFEVAKMFFPAAKSFAVTMATAV